MTKRSGVQVPVQDQNHHQVEDVHQGLVMEKVEMVQYNLEVGYQVLLII